MHYDINSIVTIICKFIIIPTHIFTTAFTYKTIANLNIYFYLHILVFTYLVFTTYYTNKIILVFLIIILWISVLNFIKLFTKENKKKIYGGYSYFILYIKKIFYISSFFFIFFMSPLPAPPPLLIIYIYIYIQFHDRVKKIEIFFLYISWFEFLKIDKKKKKIIDKWLYIKTCPSMKHKIIDNSQKYKNKFLLQTYYH